MEFFCLVEITKLVIVLTMSRINIHLWEKLSAKWVEEIHHNIIKAKYDEIMANIVNTKKLNVFL